MSIKSRLKNQVIILDGAMGTMLQKNGLNAGDCPEMFNFSHPELIESIHRAYIDAGSDIIYANTFGANAKKLPTSISVDSAIKKAIEIAKAAANGTKALVALDIGPIGELIEPLGSMTFEEAYGLFAEQVLAGKKHGADLIVIETVADLYEMKAAVLAAKENSDLPVLATMTFEGSGRSFAGCPVEAMAATLEGLGVDAMGINCSLSPEELLPTAERLASSANIPLIIKANAGLPKSDGTFNGDAVGFAKVYKKFLKMGISVIGGCCGTTPEFISELKKLKGKPAKRKNNRPSVCSGTMTVPTYETVIIGERLNPTGKKLLKQMLTERNYGYCAVQAVEQQNVGARILDVNCGVAGLDETAVLPELIKYLQSVCPLPLQIDSSNPVAIERALRIYNGKPIINSVNGEDDSLESILPLAKKYGAAVIGLTLDKSGIPDTAEKRIAIAKKIIKRAEEYGIKKSDIFIDPLTLTVSAEQSQAKETLKALRILRDKIKVSTVLGVSNISFGLPNRDKMNSAFLMAALSNGLTMPIMNPNIKEMTDVIFCYNALSGSDASCNEYVQRFSSTQQSAEVAAAGEKAGNGDVGYCILNSLKEECAAAVKRLLEASVPPLEIVEGYLIPALDNVGNLYEEKKLFLPQLISCAETAKCGFNVINERLAADGTVKNNGTILLATVEGDIHDIGKNIVKVVLENYGYRIIDLGKNVAPEKIVSTVLEHEIELVGLSALMTTTAENMRKSIKLIRENGLKCKIMVGGAVITAGFAKEIGADFYAADANASVRIAREVFP